MVRVDDNEEENEIHNYDDTNISHILNLTIDENYSSEDHGSAIRLNEEFDFFENMFIPTETDNDNSKRCVSIPSKNQLFSEILLGIIYYCEVRLNKKMKFLVLLLCL